MATAVDREALEEAVARGQELLKQGKLDDAQKAFAAALMLDDQNAKVLALLGLTYFRGGKLQQARPIYEDLVERLPTDASHRLNLGLGSAVSVLIFLMVAVIALLLVKGFGTTLSQQRGER